MDKLMISRKLEDIRICKGMTRLELANKCNTTYKKVYKWEKERRPRLENIVMLADALGVTLDDLVNWKIRY